MHCILFHVDVCSVESHKLYTTARLVLLQMDAAQVSISSSWDRLLQHAVTEVSNAFGLSDNGIVNIEARLHELLLYEQGGHFRSHQDTEKEQGMIATLVMQLPYAQGHTGGQLTVRHKGRSHKHNFAKVCFVYSILAGVGAAQYFASCFAHHVDTMLRVACSCVGQNNL